MADGSVNFLNDFRLNITYRRNWINSLTFRDPNRPLSGKYSVSSSAVQNKLSEIWQKFSGRFRMVGIRSIRGQTDSSLVRWTASLSPEPCFSSNNFSTNAFEFTKNYSGVSTRFYTHFYLVSLLHIFMCVMCKKIVFISIPRHVHNRASWKQKNYIAVHKV